MSLTCHIAELKYTVDNCHNACLYIRWATVTMHVYSIRWEIHIMRKEVLWNL